MLFYTSFVVVIIRVFISSKRSLCGHEYKSTRELYFLWKTSRKTSYNLNGSVCSMEYKRKFDFTVVSQYGISILSNQFEPYHLRCVLIVIRLFDNSKEIQSNHTYAFENCGWMSLRRIDNIIKTNIHREMLLYRKLISFLKLRVKWVKSKHIRYLPAETKYRSILVAHLRECEHTHHCVSIRK